MNNQDARDNIRVLVADDDEDILAAYREAFSDKESTQEMKVLDALAAELFDPETIDDEDPHFEVVVCSQGDDAISLAKRATAAGDPFDVVILDVRMPPGIDGVEAGSAIREMDPDVQIVFVTGFSDVPLEELRRRVPPPMNLHYFNKPLSLSRLAQDVAGMVRTQ